MYLILDYFGDTCYEFPLDKAIRQGFLTPYEYHPELVTLSSDEEDNYTDLTVQIGRLMEAAERDLEAAERLKKLLLKRAAIVNCAESKLPCLLDILSDQIVKCARKGEEPRYILVYCPPGRHREVLRAVSSLGLRCHEFVHTVSRSDRQLVLNQFADGEIQVLVAIRCLDEGVDVPPARLAIMLDNSGNPREYIQRRGRVLRKYPGKERAIIHDIIVEPTIKSSTPQELRDLERKIITKELERYRDFAKVAQNAGECLKIMENVEAMYGVDKVYVKRE